MPIKIPTVPSDFGLRVQTIVEQMSRSIKQALPRMVADMQDSVAASCPLPTRSPMVLSYHRQKAAREGRAIVRSGLADVLLWLGETP